MKNSKYDIAHIRRYLNGELDARAMYQLERQAQDDPLLMDLILGMESGDRAEHETAIAGIEQAVQERTRPSKARIVPMMRWGIAASVLLFCSITAWLLLRKDPSPGAIALNKKTESPEEPVAIIQRPTDTLKAAGRPEEPERLADKPAPPVKAAPVKLPHTEDEDRQLALLDAPAESDTINQGEIRLQGLGQDAQKNLIARSAMPGSAIQSVEQSLQGKVAGISIRGVSSMGAKSFLVSGVVKDKDNQSVLPGVAVKVKGTDIVTATDALGRFSVPVPGGEGTLELAYLGFEPASVRVKGPDSLAIAMNPSSLALNEVVVAGYGQNHRSGADLSEEAEGGIEPVDGWNKYREYLKQKAVAGKGEAGLVVLSFSVSAQGQLSDFKVARSTSPALNEKAIQLVQQGPRWQEPKKGSRKVRLRIRFREAAD